MEWWQLPGCEDQDDRVRIVKVSQSTVSSQVEFS